MKKILILIASLAAAVGRPAHTVADLETPSMSEDMLRGECEKIFKISKLEADNKGMKSEVARAEEKLKQQIATSNKAIEQLQKEREATRKSLNEQVHKLTQLLDETTSRLREANVTGPKLYMKATTQLGFDIMDFYYSTAQQIKNLFIYTADYTNAGKLTKEISSEMQLLPILGSRVEAFTKFCDAVYDLLRMRYYRYVQPALSDRFADILKRDRLAKDTTVLQYIRYRVEQFSFQAADIYQKTRTSLISSMNRVEALKGVSKEVFDYTSACLGILLLLVFGPGLLNFTVKMIVYLPLAITYRVIKYIVLFPFWIVFKMCSLCGSKKRQVRDFKRRN